MSNSSSNHKHRAGDAAFSSRLNTLGLNNDQAEQLADQLDTDAAGESSRRGSARLSYRRTSVTLCIEQPGGGSTTVRVVSRNLSKGGMSLLHAAYLHPGTRCVVVLRHKVKGDIPIKARIVRCRHVSKKVHELGVQFDHAIEVVEYVVADMLAGVFTSEIVDPGRLDGSLLLVCQQHIDQTLIKQHLTETKMSLYQATTLEDAIRQANDTLDLILADYDLGSTSAIQLMSELKKARCRVPVIVMSADQSTPVREALRGAGASACLPKPVEKQLLLRAIAEFMFSDQSGDPRGPIYSSHPSDSPLQEITTIFLREAGHAADELEKAITSGDYVTVVSRVSRMGSAARAAGFLPIAAAADIASKNLAATMSIEETQDFLDSLISCCRRARSRRSADPAPPAAAPAPGKPAAGGHGDHSSHAA